VKAQGTRTDEVPVALDAFIHWPQNPRHVGRELVRIGLRTLNPQRYDCNGSDWQFCRTGIPSFRTRHSSFSTGGSRYARCHSSNESTYPRS
jgi:hypothetical protein